VDGNKPEPTETIAAGGFRARLTLPDGSQVELDEDGGAIAGADGIAIADKTLNYDQGVAEAGDDGVFHLLEVPRGGECCIRLSDGTRVYLNSMTTLRYPARFGRERRFVELSGEAYFEVTPCATPFVVGTSGMNVRVYGTSFNVSAYGDGPRTETTLISGSVSVTAAGGQEVMIAPSEQAVFDRALGTVEVRQVDTEFYTGWKDGRMSFRDRPLDEIMQILSRWYDIDQVVYSSDAIRDMRFGLNLDRYDRIDTIIELLNMTGGVTARVEGRKIIFSE
jgi:ferric-dicitrate binding protein FerR (iron transport regulator)